MTPDWEELPIYYWGREKAEYYLRISSFGKCNKLPPVLIRKWDLSTNIDADYALSWKTKQGHIRHSILYRTCDEKLQLYRKSTNFYSTIDELIRSLGCSIYTKEEIEKAIPNESYCKKDFEDVVVYYREKEGYDYYPFIYSSFSLNAMLNFYEQKNE